MITSYKTVWELCGQIQRLCISGFHRTFHPISGWIHHCLQMLIVNLCSPIFKQTNPLAHNTIIHYCLTVFSTQFTIDTCCWQIFYHQKSYHILQGSLLQHTFCKAITCKRNCNTPFPLANLNMYWATEHITAGAVPLHPLLLLCENESYFPNGPCTYTHK